MKLHISENSSTRVKKALFGDNTEKIKTFAIMTPENPLGKELSAEENNKRLKDFKNDLRQRGIQYTKITGSYGNKEHSFMLYNVAYKEVETLARNYQQESFFHGTNSIPSEITYYKTTDKCRTYHKEETKKGIATFKDANDYFSRHGDFQFTIDMKCFESMKAINESIIYEDEIDISLEEDRTVFSRMMHRKIATGQMKK